MYARNTWRLPFCGPCDCQLDPQLELRRRDTAESLVIRPDSLDRRPSTDNSLPDKNPTESSGILTNGSTVDTTTVQVIATALLTMATRLQTLEEMVSTPEVESFATSTSSSDSVPADRQQLAAKLIYNVVTRVSLTLTQEDRARVRAKFGPSRPALRKQEESHFLARPEFQVRSHSTPSTWQKSSEKSKQPLRLRSWRHPTLRSSLNEKLAKSQSSRSGEHVAFSREPSRRSSSAHERSLAASLSNK